MAEFPLKNVAKIKKSLRQLSAEIQPFHVSSSRYGEKVGYLAVYYKKSKKVKDLQKKIIDLINPLRQGLLREKTILKMSGFKKIELKNIKRYGFQNVDSEFAPHLTFTKLSPPNKTALKKIKKTDFSFMVGQLALLRLGNHGTGRKLIATFDLKV